MSGKEVNQYCRILETNIESKWEKAQSSTKKRLEEFITNPDSFFGTEEFTSSEQWSYRVPERLGG